MCNNIKVSICTKKKTNIAIVRLSTAHEPGYLQTLDTDYGFKSTISQPTPNAALA